jgi:pimeloyl-ACP methyl ester carboxylesterase
VTEATFSRRGAAKSVGLMALASAAPALHAGPARAERARRPFVLVHGAWHGGWCWRDVRAILERRGHRVFTPTLTGLGERAHLRLPTPRLATHVQDVMAMIEAEELTDVVLVGHSYAGMVITGVADAMKDRLAHVVHLDAALPADGQSMITQSPGITPAATAATEAGLRALAPDGVWMAPPPVSVLGVPAENAAAVAWLNRRLTPHPLPTWTDPIALRNGGSEGLPRTYILCDRPVMAQASFAAHAARVAAGQAGPGWTSRRLATGHDAMVTAPAATARLLLEAATARPRRA